jgi:hypothetical protein
VVTPELPLVSASGLSKRAEQTSGLDLATVLQDPQPPPLLDWSDGPHYHLFRLPLVAGVLRRFFVNILPVACMHCRLKSARESKQSFDFIIFQVLAGLVAISNYRSSAGGNFGIRCYSRYDHYRYFKCAALLRVDVNETAVSVHLVGGLWG